MYDALLALQRALSRPPNAPMATGRIPYGLSMEEGGAALASPYEGLPDAVVRNILQQPSYGEGQVIPSEVWRNYESFAPERELYRQQRMGAPPERERLSSELNFMRYLRENPSTYPLNEGQRFAPVESPYSRPYNLGLGNLGALY